MNMTKFADLHIHTHYSDSTDSPQEVVRQAHFQKLMCIAITDHDTVAGIAPTILAAQQFSLEIVPGIELSTEIDEKDIHMLGYFFDYQNPFLLEKLKQIQEARLERIKKMIALLKKEGINNIEWEEVCQLAPLASLGRPHLATILKQKGWVRDIKEAFEKYIGDKCPAYVSKYKQTPYEAIDLIRRCGGVAVLAHPMLTNKDELIPSFIEAGLQGLEVYYANSSDTSIKYYEGIAKKHHLIMTGGSDAHGKVKNNTYVGKTQIPYETVEQLRQVATVRR